MTVTKSSPTQHSHVWTRAFAAGALALVTVSGCECTADEIRAQTPSLLSDACTEPAAADGAEFRGGFENCGVAFGDADLTERVARTISLSNPTALPLLISSFKITGDDFFSFVNEPPTQIAPGQKTEFAIQIRPRVESTIKAEIQIISNAGNIRERVDANDPKNTDTILRIPVTLTGVDNGLPDIEIVPQGCGSIDPLGVDFGRVASGGIGICTVNVSNIGARDLYFDSLAFVDLEDDGIHDEPADSAEAAAIAITGTPPGGEIALPAGATYPLRLTFSPDALGRFSTTLRFVTSDPDEPEIDMPIVGLGVIGPTCVAEIASVNGVTTPPFNVDILDDVVITTGNSTTPTTDGEVVVTKWTLTASGAGSTAVLTDPSSTETAFANRRGLDVAGRYEACAVVTDDLGTDSTNRCCVSFEAIPSQAFLVQTTWINDSGDMDMHVSRKSRDGYCVTSLGGGSGSVDAPFAERTFGNDGLCADVDQNDCFWSNCKTNERGPEWDGLPGRTAGDPFLDIDDVSGFGPENINIDEVVPGSYGFGVSTYSNPFSGDAAVVTMRLFIFGRLAGVWQEEIESEFWEVGIVHFTTPTAFCIEDLTDGDPQNDCPGL